MTERLAWPVRGTSFTNRNRKTLFCKKRVGVNEDHYKDMVFDKLTSNTPTEQQKIRSIIEKLLVQAPPDVKAAFPPVLRQGRVLSAIISQPEYLIIAFLTAEEEKRFRECVSKQTDPFVGLITTGPERAVFRVEKARNTSARSCTVTNSFGFSLGPDSTILLEDHHQIVETADIGMVSYTVPLAYIISYGDDIDRETAYDYLEGLIIYSTNMWRENMWLTTWPGSTKSCAASSRLLRTRN